MSPHPDVLLIGGGVIGLTSAYYLAGAGLSVTVVDKGDLGQESSWAGAGIITPGNPARARSPLGQLKARSAAMYPGLSTELRELTGIDNGYVKCGGLELRRSSDELERQRIDNLLREERGEGLYWEVLDARQLRELEPALSDHLPGAVLFPEMAQVRNPRHLKALIAACGRRGVHLLPGCPVFAFDRRGDQITGIRTSSGTLAAGCFLITAGSWSDLLLDLLGYHAGIRPIRGQIVLLNTSPPLLKHILQTGSEYLVPRPDGRVLIGSTEEDVGFNKQTTAEAVQRLLAWAMRFVPALAQAPVERGWAGLRPGNADGKPVLGPVPGFQNLYVAAGHFRTGIHLSPITGLLMKELLLGEPLTVPLDAFRLDRFAQTQDIHQWE
jgi:glycine oxidase